MTSVGSARFDRIDRVIPAAAIMIVVDPLQVAPSINHDHDPRSP
jgi:hypothetical protein